MLQQWLKRKKMIMNKVVRSWKFPEWHYKVIKTTQSRLYSLLIIIVNTFEKFLHLSCSSPAIVTNISIKDSSLFQIFRRFFLRMVWLLIIVSYVSESKKLILPSRNFGLGACDIIMMSMEPQKLVFLPWAQSKVMETIVNDHIFRGTTETTFSIKVNNSVTSHNSEWGLVTSSDLENALLWFKVKTKTWKRIKAIVFQVNLQKPFF